jgi:hypothetical protein
MFSFLCWFVSDPESTVAAQLTRFLTSLKTYFYPTNAGAWSGPLTTFVMELATLFSSRVGMNAPMIKLNIDFLCSLMMYFAPQIRPLPFTLFEFLFSSISDCVLRHL